MTQFRMTRLRPTALKGLAARAIGPTAGHRARALRGGLWSVMGFGASQGLRLVTNLVLARFLLPAEAFGAVVIVNVLLAGLEMFSDLGLQQAVVQHARGEERGFRNVAFTIQALRGVLLAMLACAAAFPVAEMYPDIPGLAWLLVAAAMSSLVRGVTSSVIWSRTRRVDVRSMSSLTVASEIAGMAGSLVWAWGVSASAWALVAGTLITSVVYVAGSQTMDRWQDRFAWDRETVRELLKFGGWMTLSSATFFLGSQAERLVMGVHVTAAELGCFGLAAMIAFAPTRGITQVVGQVYFPMIAALRRDRPADALAWYRKARWMTTLAAVCVGGGLIALGPWFVRVFVNQPDFEPTGWMLQIMSLRVAADIMGNIASATLFAYGISKASAISNIARIAFLLVGLFAAFTWGGIREAMWVMSAAPFVSMLFTVVALERVQPGTLGVEARCVAACAAGFGAVWACANLLG